MAASVIHITVRLRPSEQVGPKVADLLGHFNSAIAVMLRLKLNWVRHQIWNEKWASAVGRMRDIFLGAGDVIGFLRPVDAERVQRFRQHLLELRNYLRNNCSALINYAHMRRQGR
jgi:hypothetical protein